MSKIKKQPHYAMHRTRRNILIAAGFFILLPVVMVVDHRYGHSLRRVVQQATYAAGDWETYHNQTVAVVEIFDGDTIAVNIPDGDAPTTRVRLIGVDTPETHHPTLPVMYYGPQATEFTRQKVLGRQVTLKLDTIGDIRDRYGRLLAYVVIDEQEVLNAELIAKGYGYAYLPFPHSDSHKYKMLMDEAIEAKRGLWAEAARDDLPKWLRSKRPDLLRYP